MSDYSASLYQQEHATIYGRNVWHYLLDTSIGQIHVVEMEARGLELQRVIIDGNNQKAEKVFKKMCNAILSGKGV